MKNMNNITIAILIFITCTACKNSKSRSINIERQKTSIESTIQKHELNKQIDSLSFEFFLTLAESNEVIPKKIATNYLTEFDYEYKGSGRKFYDLNEIVVAFVTSNPHGVCNEVKSLTFAKNGEPIDELVVEAYCDSDGENHFDNYSFKIFADTIIEIYTENQIKHFIIKSNGIFERVFENISYPKGSKKCLSSYRILAEQDLGELTKIELRILRNEIFARKGYIFKSKDLLDHFSQFSWYKPTYDEISSYWLTPIQKYNIDLILKYEKK